MEKRFGLHVPWHIGFKDFWAFLWDHKAEMLRYLRWATEQASAKTNQASRFRDA